MKNKQQKGFTVVELVIAIAVIAILAAVLIPTFASLIQKANESKIYCSKGGALFLIQTEASKYTFYTKIDESKVALAKE